MHKMKTTVTNLKDEGTVHLHHAFKYFSIFNASNKTEFLFVASGNVLSVQKSL